MPVGSLALSVHSISGSVPAAIGMHVPSLPGMLHVPHLSQLTLQQTPSLQVPEKHCVLRVQAWPMSNTGGHCEAAPPSAPASATPAVARRLAVALVRALGIVEQLVLHLAFR